MSNQTLDSEAYANIKMVDNNTFRENNDKLLGMLKSNDFIPSMRICDESYYPEHDAYVPSGCENELEYLGYCIGNNISLSQLRLDLQLCDPDSFDNGLSILAKGISLNRAIEKIEFHGLSGNQTNIFEEMIPFFENNEHLSKIEVDSCELRSEGCRLLSKAIEECSKSLTHFCLSIDSEMYRIPIDEGQTVCVIDALSKHPQLEKVEIYSSILQPAYGFDNQQYREMHPPTLEKECVALSNLLQCVTGLHTLKLADNGFRDNEIEVLANSIRIATYTLSVFATMILLKTVLTPWLML